MKLGIGIGLEHIRAVGGLADVPVVITFESSWKTDNAGTSNDDQITLPLHIAGTYDFNVDWGDGTDDDITAWDDAAKTHTYAGGAGTYTVKITGTIIGWAFLDGGDKLKILKVDNWESLRLGNTNAYFRGCANLIINATDTLDLTGSINWLNAFRGCMSLASFDVSNWDTSSVTIFWAAFWDCTSLATIDVSNWDVTSVTTVNSMFRNCTSLTIIGVDSWDITNITNMTQMFIFVTLTTATYDAILISWGAQAAQNNVSFHAGNSKYTGGGAAEAARAHLILAVGSGGHGWTITDGGTV